MTSLVSKYENILSSGLLRYRNLHSHVCVCVAIILHFRHSDHEIAA